ncbi:MAG TPA: Hsp20 family protein [Acetobacteraceae bacterium]|nr:Hsp20 family protein [Acetobacteraceae bacterium]
MRTYDFAPLFRSTIGFDRILEMLDDSSPRPGWPPYNIEKTDGDRYRIKMAIAGFSPQEVDVTQQGNTLTVTGKKTDTQDHAEMLHQGIAFRNFRQTFNLTEHVKVVAADLDNGLLSIGLVREVPEELRPRRIPIGVGTKATIPAQDNRPKLAEQPDSVRQSKAA